MKDQDPIENVRFYSKDDLTTAFEINKNQVWNEDFACANASELMRQKQLCAALFLLRCLNFFQRNLLSS